MSQTKMFAVHCEADSRTELVARIKTALVELVGLSDSTPTKKEEAAPAAEAPKRGPGRPKKDAAPAPAAKITVDAVKQALTALRDAVGGEGDPDKKGIKQVKIILKKFSAATTAELKEDQFQAVMEAIQEAMPKADEDEAEEEDGF